MPDFVLATHTRWDEAPRVRHQVARLLRDSGHRVLFIERAGQFGRDRSQDPREVEPGITAVRGTRLLHHQLRVLPALHRAEAVHAGRQAERFVRSWGAAPGFTVVNFMHDGWFLRSRFPGSRIVTVIHDDFEAQSRLPFRGHITWTLSRTCRASDTVLASSEPLVRRLSAWCRPSLFLPWSVTPYSAPSTGAAGRDTLLFWGYVDNAIDLDAVRALSAHLAASRPGWRLLFVGPTQTRGARERIAAAFAELPNVDLRDRAGLDELPIGRVLAAILPYRRTPAIDSVTLANKCPQLLARGLPLLISTMPAFIRREFVIRLDGPGGLEAALAECEARFTALQPEIQRFCLENSPESRLRLLGVEPG
jgi:hypothetical protein